MINRILNEVASRDLIVDTIFINTAMDAYIRAGDPLPAIELFASILALRASWAAPGENQLQAILEKHFIVGNSRTSRMHEYCGIENVTPNVRTFNTLLKALRSCELVGYRCCVDIAAAITSAHISFDTISVNTLVDIFVQSGDFKSAEELVENSNFTSGVEAYTAIIAGYADKRKVRDAFRIIDHMATRNVKPNKLTLTSLMNACFNSGDRSSARSLLNKAVRASSSSKEDLQALHRAYIIGLCRSNYPNITEVFLL